MTLRIPRLADPELTGSIGPDTETRPVPDRASCDWMAIAQLLADLGEILVLDGEGRIALVSNDLAQSLGFPPDALEGKRWVERFTPPSQVAAVTRQLRWAERGVGGRLELEAMRRDGSRVLLAGEASSVGRTGRDALVIIVESVTELSDRACGPPLDADYDVRVVADMGRFELVRLRDWTDPRSDVPEGRCFEVIAGRQAPCDGCPLNRPDDAPWPRRAVRIGRGEPPMYEIITAERLSADLARVSLRSVPVGVLPMLNEARLHDLAERSQLSPRETEVLRYVAMGRTLTEIATVLGITPRTAKFHQANMLVKLGADSRTDLLRLLI